MLRGQGMKKIKKGNRHIKYWEIEDSIFSFFELYENNKCIWWGMTGTKCLKDLLEND
jgi:hypothetical protein